MPRQRSQTADHREGLPVDGFAVASYPIDEILRQAIRQGLLAPGTRLIQRDIASVLGVSRIPVREVLRQLAAEGLITFEAGQSARVTELSAEEIDELYSLRLLVEPAMAAAIVRNYGPAEFAELERAVRDMDAAGVDTRSAEWSDANFRFHEVLYRSSRQRHHYRIAIQLLTLTETYSRLFVFELAGGEESQMEHHEMLEALIQRDAERLEQLLQKHLYRAHRDLVQYSTQPAGERRDGESEIPEINVVVKNFADRFKMLADSDTPAEGKVAPNAS